MNFPSDIGEAVAGWLAGRAGSRLAGARAMTARYAEGGSSAGADVAAYLAARAPATYAAVRRVLELVSEVMPELAPARLLDVGAGPGVASWAALDAFSSLRGGVGLDANPDFVAAAMAIAEGAGVPLRFEQGEVRRADFPAADLVIASYVIAELSLDEMRDVLPRLWAAAETLVIVEPGTRHGFERVRAAREILLRAGAQVIAPCTHAAACPMIDGDWCHFKVRLARGREHMHAKGAVVPFEDEPFSYLAVTKRAVVHGGARVVRPPRVNKVAAVLPACSDQGLREISIASRDKPLYKLAKATRWGDRWL